MTIGRVDAIGDQSTAPGTSDFVIDGVALTGMLAFAGKLTDGYTYRYRAQNSDNSVWEVGGGVWTAATTTLSRVTTYQSSNGGAKANFTGTTAVVIAMTAADFADAATDANISMSDITTNDVSITKHGFVPKAPNDSAKYLNGVGAWATVSGMNLGANSFTATQTITPAANTSALVLASQTHTASSPVVDAAQTWNNVAVTFTGWKFNVTNTASAAASLLADLQTGGVSKFSVGYLNGLVGCGAVLVTDQGYGLYSFKTNVSDSFRADASGIAVRAGLMAVKSSFVFQFSSTANWYDTIDTGVARNAAGVVEINNGTAGTLRDLKVRNLLAGGGNGSYVQTPSMTVANLATAATAGAGARAFVTDANTTMVLGIGTTVVGGGANKVPVYCDGAAWLIG